MQTLRSVVRILALTLAILTAIAIGLGRYGPRPIDQRQPGPPRYRSIAEQPYSSARANFPLLNVATGTIERLTLAESERLQYAACSPWRDSQGRSHLVGFWLKYEGKQIRGKGIARYAMPGSEVLDQVPLNTAPGSRPCWFPGTSAKVLFAGWDGRLYTYSFDEPAHEQRPGEPTPLSWRTSAPWKGNRLFWEPSWPTDPRFGGKLIVSLTFKATDRPGELQTRTELWWLKLNNEGTVIEDLGRLITPASDEPVSEERLACVTATPQGDLALAYLVRRERHHDLQLQLAPIQIDEETGNPVVAEADAVTLPGARLANPPAFSADGRWVYATALDRQPEKRYDSYSVADFLPGAHDKVLEPDRPTSSVASAPTARAPRKPIPIRTSPWPVPSIRLGKS